MTTPALLPCPFCGGTHLGDADPDEWGLLYVECNDCGARGPTESYTLAVLEASKAKAAAAWNQRSAWQPIETAPRDGTEILAWDGIGMRFAWRYEGRWIYDIDMESPYLTPWHPTHWQPLPSHPPITPSAPHAFTEGQSITVDGIQGPHAHWNGTYVVDSASSFVQIHDKNGGRLDCEVVTRFSVGDETYLVLDPAHPAVCLIHIKDDGSGSTQFVESSDKDFDKILSAFEEVLNDCAFSLGLSECIAIEPFGGHLIAIGLDLILEEGADGADLDNLETPEEGKEFWNFLVSFHFYHGDSRGHQEYGLYFREPDFYYVAKSSDLVLVKGDEMDMVRQAAEAAIDAVLPPAEEAPPITP